MKFFGFNYFVDAPWEINGMSLDISANKVHFADYTGAVWHKCTNLLYRTQKQVGFFFVSKENKAKYIFLLIMAVIFFPKRYIGKSTDGHF